MSPEWDLIQGVSVGGTAGLGVCRILVLKLTFQKRILQKQGLKSAVLVSLDR